MTHWMARKKLEAAWRRAYKIEAHGKQGGLCCYCKAPIPLAIATAEHKKPRKHGGKDRPNNIAAACSSCNLARGHKTRAEFMRAIHEPDIIKDPWPLYVACAGIRVSLAAHAACRRIRRMVESKGAAPAAEPPSSPRLEMEGGA